MITARVIDRVQWYPGIKTVDVELTSDGWLFRGKRMEPGDFILTLADQRKILFRVNYGVVNV